MIPTNRFQNSTLLALGFMFLAACTPHHDKPGTIAGDVASQEASADASEDNDIALSASFDCSGKVTGVASSICSDPQLAKMDVELARLVHMAAQAPKADLAALRAGQSAFVAERAGCDLQPVGRCLPDAYARRIADLRAGGLGKDDGGISLGPVRWACPGGTLTSTFINTNPAQVWLAQGTATWLLPQAGSGSGARYAENGYEFWTKGNQTAWTQPGKPAVACAQINGDGA